MTLYQNKYRVETTRLQIWNYASDGWYFITICTKGHENVLGRIEQCTMQSNQYGRIAEQCWFDLPNHYPNLALDAFVVMPDHLHGIMIIDNSGETIGSVHGGGNNSVVETGLKPVSTGPSDLLGQIEKIYMAEGVQRGIMMLKNYIRDNS